MFSLLPPLPVDYKYSLFNYNYDVNCNSLLVNVGVTSEILLSLLLFDVINTVVVIITFLWMNQLFNIFGLY